MYKWMKYMQLPTHTMEELISQLSSLVIFVSQEILYIRRLFPSCPNISGPDQLIFNTCVGVGFQ